jgi:hypothetical protein
MRRVRADPPEEDACTETGTYPGWLDTRSLEQCYQQADEATLLQVVSEPRKLRETIAETIAAASGKP